MSIPTRRLYLLGGLTLLAMFATPAFASNVLDQTTSQFQVAAQSFGTQMQALGMRLLFLLATIQMGVNGIKTLTKQSSMEEMLSSLAMTVIVVCFWAGILKSAQTWLPSIIDGFDWAGQQGSGLGKLSPSAIIDQGIDLMGTMKSAFLQATGSSNALTALLSNPQPAMEMVAIEFVIFLSFVVLAFQMVMTTISGYFWLAVTPLLLGFGGLTFTRDMAISGLKGGVAIGGKILVTYLLAGVAAKLGPILGGAMGSITLSNMQPMWECAASALIFAFLSWQLPKLAGDLLNGTASLSAGEAMSGIAMTAAGAAGLALGGASAASALGSAMGHAGSATAAAGGGLMKALGAGINSGLDLGKSGAGLATHTLGQMGEHGLGMAKGAIGDALGGARTGFAQKVDNSLGGRVASSINATRGGSMAPVAPPAPTPQSVGAQSGAPSAQALQTAASNDGGGGDGASVEQSETAPESAGASATSAAASSGASSPTTPASAANASTASITGGSPSPVTPSAPSALASAQQRMKEFASYVPPDAHTVGLNANITAHGHD
ncbi:type IV secretion system protein [Burkholderia orbicola]|uniref:type IV secretion system protein n=1 Tax=Burkholderia orbicola TaxID=2978683 RepID=UPI002FE3D012